MTILSAGLERNPILLMMCSQCEIRSIRVSSRYHRIRKIYFRFRFQFKLVYFISIYLNIYIYIYFKLSKSKINLNYFIFYSGLLLDKFKILYFNQNQLINTNVIILFLDFLLINDCVSIFGTNLIVIKITNIFYLCLSLGELYID